MLPADDGGPDRGLMLRRYGPLAVIVVLLLVVGAVVLTGGDGDDGGGSAGDGSGGEVEWADAGATEPGPPAPTGEMPTIFDEAEEQEAVGDHEWTDTCDTDSGNVMLPSVYALPCVPSFEGDNGGATAGGVTDDTVKVVFYIPDQSADLSAVLSASGANDTPEQRIETLERYIELYASVTEQYGRTVDLVPFHGTGAADDVVASNADATDIIAMDPFAVIGGPALDRGTFAQEIADAGVLCMGCTTALPDSMIRENAPYLWGAQPSVGQILDLLTAWVETRDVGEGSVAERAGGDLEGAERKLGVIHFEQDPPIFSETADERSDIADVALTETYVLDTAALPAKATELIGQFKAEGITTITFLGDPLMPIYLTQAATEQDYYPEWVFTGTTLTDTNFFARQYDQAQMANASGISQLAAPAEQDLQEYVRLWRWYDGGDGLPPAENQYALVAPNASWLMAGIHMAGPELTAETFARGMFRIPPTGGGPTTPQISYGNWGFFPEMDYNAVDDAVEIWWDPDVEAEDERGAEGTGVWRRSNGARRFTADETPESNLFTDVESTVTVVEELTGEDVPPEYPPPEGSPAAGG